MLESKYQRKIIKDFESRGYYVLNLIKTNKSGIPDLLALKKGEEPTFIEVKGRKGVVSKQMKELEDKQAIEWLILIGLFKATIEQKSMLIGVEKQRAKQLFNNWMRQGTNILSKFEANFTDEQLEELSLLVETSMNGLRKNIIVVN